MSAASSTPGMDTRTIVAGTRTSPLARWQTDHVLALLGEHWPQLTTETRDFRTSGDLNLDTPLPAMGGKGAFTAELERALREKQIDIAVHSLKDLPVAPAEGLTVGAIPRRADARDALIVSFETPGGLDTLHLGAVVGTSSHRRAAQLLLLRPDLVIRPIRGNVQTRMRKVRDGEYAATVLAAAGLERLGLLDRAEELFSFDQILPAPGQGALAVQCRADDADTLALLKVLEDPDTRDATTAERTFLHALGGGCSAPVAALATRSAGGSIYMRGLIAARDGSAVIRVDGTDRDPNALGAQLAADALAAGADELLRLEASADGDAATG